MIQLIQLATSSTSNTERQDAERKIIQLRDGSPDQFYRQVIDVLGSTEVPAKIRETSATLIAVTTVAKAQSGGYVWDAITGNTKNQVKTSCLGALIDSDRNIRRSAANAVSAICYVQLPRNEWEGIVEKICANVNHQNEVVKESSVLTLGFICSRMKQLTGFEFNPQVQKSILSGIILCFQQSQQLLIKTALKALRDSMSSLSATLKNTQNREYVLKQIVQIVSNKEYAESGLQILGQFVKTCYEYLGPYMDGIPKLLEPIIANHSNQNCCIAAMEVWENIAEEYKQTVGDNRPNYITGPIGQMVVVSLLNNLAVMEDEEENDDNPISDSASKALQTIFENGSLEYQQLVLEFVKVSIAQNDWKHRQASIKGFSLLLYGLSDQQNQALISSSINELIGLLNDTSKQVQYATMESLTIITEVCGKFILTSPHFVDYLQLIVSKLSLSEKFLKTGCRIVDNLCEAEKQYKLGKFTAISNDLIDLFLKFALNSSASLAIISWSTTTIMNILEVTQNHSVILKYLTFVLENFDNLKQISEKDKRQTVTSAFFTFMQFCLHGLKKANVDQAVIMAVYTKVTNYFKTIKDVNADGFYAIEALVSFFNGSPALVEDFWGYIVHALQKLQDPVMFRATISCLASFVICYGDTLAPKLESFVPLILNLVTDASFGKQLKLDCLVILGEVFLSCGRAAQQYLQQFLQVILLCCSAALQMADTDFGYSESLKDNVVEALMCVVHGLNVDKYVNQQIPGFIPQIFNFAALSCNKSYKPTVAYIKKCLLLLADLAKFYPSVVKPLKQDQFIDQSIKILKNFNKAGEYTPIINYVKSQFK